MQGIFDGGWTGCKSTFVRNFFPACCNEGDRDLFGFESAFLKKFVIPICLFVAVFSPNCNSATVPALSIVSTTKYNIFHNMANGSGTSKVMPLL